MPLFKENYNTSLSDIVANHIPAMLAYWDKDLVCRFANVAYLEWFGKTSEQMIDKMTIKELLGPVLFDKNLPYITAALEGKNQNFEREIPLPAGEIRYALANYSPNIVGGEVIGFFVHVADITSVKLLEKRIIKSNEIINYQNRQLLNFSNIVSHNLKSYANNLDSILGLYEKSDSETMKEKMFGFLKNISKGFSATVKNLLEIAKAHNESKIDLEKINVNTYILRAIETLQLEITNCEVFIENNILDNTKVMANPAYMDSIFQNFLSNSIKYRHPDRIPKVILNSFIEGKYTAISIKDNGIGIDLNKHGDKLFGMNQTFHGNPDAQGIGLYITRYQIETMGGDVKVESEAGEGTTFTVYLNSAN